MAAVLEAGCGGRGLCVLRVMGLGWAGLIGGWWLVGLSVRFGLVRFDSVRFGSVWFSLSWVWVWVGWLVGLLWLVGSVWFGLVWFGLFCLVWFGSVRWFQLVFYLVCFVDCVLF